MIKSIAVIGVGGVGGFFGGKLCALISRSIHVSFVARGEHLRAIQKDGLTINTETEGEVVVRPSLVTENIAEIPTPDLVLLCVKEFDLAEALLRLKPLIRDATVILPLLNGMDVYTRVRRWIQNGVVLPACVYVGTHIERPGKVSQRGGACKIFFGPDPRHSGFYPDSILRLFEDAKIKSEWSQRVQEEIWTKFIFICAYGTVTAAHDKSVGEVFADGELRRQVEEIMHETVAVAAALGVALPADVIKTSLAKAKNFPFETKTSFQRDFEKRDKKDERNLFAGALVERAREVNLAIPRTEALLAQLNQTKPIL